MRARASAKVTPVVSVSASASESAVAPDQMRLPVVTPNRPSSSWKLTAEMGGPPASAAARASSSPQITPSAPSSQPPSGWLSECEPTSSDFPAGERPQTVPTGSNDASSPAAR